MRARSTVRPFDAIDTASMSLIMVFIESTPTTPVMLARQVEPRTGWCGRTWFDVGVFPHGFSRPPSAQGRTRTIGELRPTKIHPADAADVANSVAAAFDRGDPRFIAWPL